MCSKGLITCLHRRLPRSGALPTRTTPTASLSTHAALSSATLAKRPPEKQGRAGVQTASEPKPARSKTTFQRFCVQASARLASLCVVQVPPRGSPCCFVLHWVRSESYVRQIALINPINLPPWPLPPLALLRAPSCVACARGVAVGQRRSFTRKCRAAARSSLSAPTHKTQLLPLALGAQPRGGHRADRLPNPYQRQTICQRKICKSNKVELITFDFDDLNI